MWHLKLPFPHSEPLQLRFVRRHSLFAAHKLSFSLRSCLPYLLSLVVISVSTAAAQTQSAPTDAFERWRIAISDDAANAGRDGQGLRDLLAEIAPDPEVLRRADQPSNYRSPTWTYVDRRLDPLRIAEGQTALATHAPLLQRIESRFGVEPATVVAVWGMETRYGAAALRYDAVRSIATLAFLGKRKRFTDDLFALVDALRLGVVERAELQGSWDGGLGQAQIMPREFVDLAIDWDEDGKRDLWGNYGDIFASIAHVLKSKGWRHGEPVLDEISPPMGDAATFIGARSLSQWIAADIRRADGAPWRPQMRDRPARLWRPEGALGPTFLVYANFDALKGYNGASNYGLAAALLASAVSGGDPRIFTPWPVPPDTLSTAEIFELQTLLNALGYDAGEADGLFGATSFNAVEQMRGDLGATWSIRPSQSVLAAARKLAAAK